MALVGRNLLPRYLGQGHCFRLPLRTGCSSLKLRLLAPSDPPVRIPCASKVTVFQTHKKAGYEKKKTKQTPVNKLKASIEGLKMLKPEINLFLHEWKEKFESDCVLDRKHLDHTYLFHFRDQQEIDKWVVTSDSDHGEGFSKGTFELNKNANGLFHGHLSTQIPKDGIVKDAGYVNIRSPRLMRSFKRPIPYDLSRFTHLVFRVRGDGRTYMINLQMDMTFDIHWDDVYNFALYTRGGPYWQVAKIPISRFYKSFKGRIQDKQYNLTLDRISNFGITLGDGNSGPFHLEIDYIGAIYDMNHDEEFAWEMYKAEPYTVGV